MKQKLLTTIFAMACLSSVSFAQTREVSGLVTASDGTPISGASISVVGANTATQTDETGRFKISASSGSTLNVSYIGYTTQRVSIGNSTNLTIVLQGGDQTLDEVVVTGLGVSKSSRGLGYSVSNVSGEDLNKSAEANIIQGLAAKATGVQITSSSGTPGASSKIVLRGPASFSGDNQPLIVVDGVPIDNSLNNIKAGDDPYNQNLAGVQLGNRALDINPEDIESVSILKGPAAAAIYGQAAGNGAIIYTTKKGKFGSGIGITYSTSFEMSNVNKLPEVQTSYGQGTTGIYTPTNADSWGESLKGKTSYNNVENFFKTGAIFNNNLSITSGSEKTLFRFAVGSHNNKGVVPHSSFNRYTSRLSSESKLNDNISIGGTLSYTNSNTRATQNGSNVAGVMLALLRSPADFDLSNYKNEDGSQNSYFSLYDNPLWSTENNPFKEQNNRIGGNAFADFKLNDIFTISWKTGLDSYSTEGFQVYAVGSNGDDNSSGLGELKRTNVNFRNLYSDLLFKFNSKLTEDISVSGLFGGNFNYAQYTSNFGRGRDLSMPGFYNFASAKELYVSNYEEYKNSKALLLDATFDYRNILFLTLTGRNEWSTTFGKKSKGFFYPKADISYIFSSHFDQSSVVNYGKIRFAYANVGISPSVYSDRAYYTVPTIADGMTNGFSFPYLGQTGFALSNVAVASEFKPERNKGYEAGLELKLFESRIGLDFTYYQQHSSDLLISQPIDPTTGYAYYYNNIGAMKNIGYEIGLTGHIVKTDKFNWYTTLNWSKNENEVTELAEGVTELSIGSAFSAPQSYAIVGQPYGVLYAQKFKRSEDGKILINPANGRAVYEDQLGNVGSPIPDWLMNWNNEFSYNDLTVSFLWDFRKGGKIWGGTYTQLLNRGKAIETEDRERMYVIDGVYESGPDEGKPNKHEITAFDYFKNYLGNSNSEIAIQDGSWVRLRSLDINYRFKKVGKNIQYIQVGLNLRNPLLFTDYKGVDPETSLTGSSQNFAGYDYFNNPGTKSYSLNFKFGF